MIKAFFAVDLNNGIGKNGTLPWPKNSKDLKRFKAATYGKTVVMGGNTWFDPVMPKPLPGRTNIVITKRDIDIPEVITLHHEWKEFIIRYAKHDEIYVIGGASILEQTKDIIEEIELTQYNNDYDCDVKINLDGFLKGFNKTFESKLNYGSITTWKKNI